MEAEETPHYNTGVMVIPKHYKSVLNYPEVINFPTHHCAEQDYLRHRIHRSCKVFEFDKNPTAEHMASYLYWVLKINKNLPIKKVGIIESFEDSIAWFEG